MARVTSTEVTQIISTDLADSIVDSYITGANAIVTEVLGDDTTITSTLKKEIERWLTAHLLASTRERMATKEEAKDVGVTYTGKYGMGLNSTAYGQTVLAMDATGKMAKYMSGARRASIYAITSFS